MAEILLSIIIPVYNVDNYLAECVNSIRSQCNDSCELILIDDGSTDSSGFLCDSFEDNIVKVVHKQNEGLGATRNVGINIATGKYVSFVDSDDRVTSRSIQRLINWISSNDNTDICFLEGIKFYSDDTSVSMGDEIVRDKVRNQRKTQVIKHLASRPKFPGSSCTKVYRRAFLVENNIAFPSDRRVSEDLWFVMECFLLAKTFDELDFNYYEYRQNREGSITNTVSSKSYYDLASFIEFYSNKLTINRTTNHTINKWLMSFVAYEYIQLTIDYNFLPITERSEAMIFLKEYYWTLRYAFSRRVRLVRFVFSITGLKLGSKLISIYLKHR